MDKDAAKMEGETISSNRNLKIEDQQIKSPEPCGSGSTSNLDFSILKNTKLNWQYLKNNHSLIETINQLPSYQQPREPCAPNFTANLQTDNNNNNNDDNENKVKLVQRRSHIPYILNGELYQIETQKGENVTVKCCNCPPDRVYRGSVRSTGNFHMHIKRRHPHLMSKLHEMKVQALLERRERIIKQRIKIPSSMIQQRRATSIPSQKFQLPSNKTFYKIKKIHNTGEYVNNKKDTTDFNDTENENQQHFAKFAPNAGTLADSSSCSSSSSTSSSSNGSNHHQQQQQQKIQPKHAHQPVKSDQLDTQNRHTDGPSILQALLNKTPVAPIDLSKNSASHASISNPPPTRGSEHVHNLLRQITQEMSTATATSATEVEAKEAAGTAVNKDMLENLRDTLQRVEHAMSVRNRLESNRILFNISKFKYLHPDFVFEF